MIHVLLRSVATHDLLLDLQIAVISCRQDGVFLSFTLHFGDLRLVVALPHFLVVMMSAYPTVGLSS